MAIDLPVCLVELADQDFALVEQSLETAAETMGNEPSWGWVQQAAAIRFLLRHGWFTRALAESEPLTDL